MSAAKILTERTGLVATYVHILFLFIFKKRSDSGMFYDVKNKIDFSCRTGQGLDQLCHCPYLSSGWGFLTSQ